MAQADDTAASAAKSAQKSGGLRGLMRRIRGKGEPTTPPLAEAAQAAAADLARQAEAFQTLRIADVMTPRADIVAVEVDTAFEEVVARFTEAEHSRMPIYRETLDDPVGVVHVKDIFRLLAAPPEEKPAPGATILRKVRRKVLYVPASMRAADLLPRMQAGRIHMALVIDEFGGCDGLVTLEDLVEAVVGDIADEHDENAAPDVVRRGEELYEADARTAMDELDEAVGRDLVPPDLEEEIDTLAGLVTALAGRVPQRGEVIAHPDGHEFEVMDADPRRVKRVRLRLAPPAAAETADAAS